MGKLKTKWSLLITLMASLWCAMVFSAPQEPTKLSEDRANFLQTLQRFGLTVEELTQKVKDAPFHLPEAMTLFTRGLFDAVNSNPRTNDVNVILSPFSIHTALSMTFLGSPKDSRTNQELSSALGLNPDEHEVIPYNYLRLLGAYDELRMKYDTQIQFANKIYIAQDFTPKQSFHDILSLFYFTTVERVNFGESGETVDKINNFVSEKTKGLIPKLLSADSVDALTRLVLINAIYFKANWKYTFDKSQTKERAFHLLEREDGRRLVTQHPAMRITAEFRTTDLPNARVLEMPYEDPDFSMLIILPNENTQSNLNEVLKTFDTTHIRRELDDSHSEEIRLQVPSFDLEFESSLSETLMKMGVRDLFDDARADLSDMTDERVAVSDVVHLAKVKVDEEGSEAAAATAVIIGIRSGSTSRKPRLFVVDRPFVFVIYDRRNDIPLFVGKILNPRGKDDSSNQQLLEDKSAPQQQEELTKEGEFDEEEDEEKGLGSALPSNRRAPPPSQANSDKKEGDHNSRRVDSQVYPFYDYPEDEEREEFEDEESEEEIETKHTDREAIDAAIAATIEAIETNRRVGNEEKIPFCDEVSGYEIGGEHESIRFPCRGRDTPHIEENERNQRKQSQEALMDLVQRL